MLTTTETQRRQVSWVLAASDQGLFITNVNDRATYNDNTYGVGYELLRDGVYSAELTNFIIQALTVRRKTRETPILALDIGANIGVLTVSMARYMLGWGEVIAFEPQEKLFQALCGNILINNVPNATAVNKAVGNLEGYIAVPCLNFDSSASYGSLSLTQGVLNFDLGCDVPEESKTVSVVSIDGLHFPTYPDFIKIDVEGMELEVLTGASRTISVNKPMIIVEALKTVEGDIRSLLEYYNYHIFKLGADLIAVSFLEAQLLGIL